METITILRDTPEGDTIDLTVAIPTPGTNEWNTYRLAAEEFLAADDLVVANTGTITLRTRWATVTFDSTHGNTVHLTGEVGPFRPTDIGVNWVTGPDGTDILVTTDCN
jgi:hypothetical protein